MTDEEALALPTREWAAFLKTLRSEKRKAELRRLRKNATQDAYRKRLDPEGQERELRWKREWWQTHRTDPEFKRKRAAKARKLYRQAKLTRN